MASIDALGLADDMAAQVKHVYLERLDLAAALAERDRIERERQALAAYEATTKGKPEKPAEQQTVAQPPEPAVRLPFPHPLPLCRRAVRQRGARVQGGLHRPLGSLPSP